MTSYPKDRFDEVPPQPSRVGAHRAPQRGGRGWIGVLWALLAVVVLTFGGLFVVSQFINLDLGLFPTASPTSTAAPAPTSTAVAVDPATIDPARAITITVLNGTLIEGLHETAGVDLTAAGWPIGSQANASVNDIKKTRVYYSDPTDEGIALGLVAALGLGQAELVSPETYPGASVTIVLGADYSDLKAPQ